MGRPWESLGGNLHASHLIRLRPGDPEASSLAFVAAVAICETLMAQVPLQPFLIKWPNDVLVRGAKLSGILLERTGDAVVMGIGINLAHAPDGLQRAVTSVADLAGQAPEPDGFLQALARHFALWLDQWRHEGVAPILVRWQELAHPRGAPLSVYLPDGERLEGHYDGLDRSGTLLLRLADGGVRAIHAGDVFMVGG